MGLLLVIRSTSCHWKDLSSSGVPLITFRHREYLFSSELPLVIDRTSRHRECLLSLIVPLVIGSTSYNREYLLSSKRPLLIGRTSCHRKDLSSSAVPLIIGSTSRHRKDLSSWGVLLIIRSTSYYREYLLSSERPLLVAPLVVDSHFCQTGRAILNYNAHSSFPRVHVKRESMAQRHISTLPELSGWTLHVA